MDRIVLFDGVCNFCNGAVNWIISHDPEKKFRFAPLQSALGNDLRLKHDIGDDIDSIIYIEDGHAYTHSTAGLEVARALGGVWSVAYALIVVPKPIRDLAYKLFAKYRYAMFGRQDACMLPTPDVRERFLA
jgi:predicted DCC family thiol-disulfide oxidoreductase YuxK